MDNPGANTESGRFKKMINVKKVHSDARGEIVVLEWNDREILVFTIRRGYGRGGDYHKSKNFIVVLAGKVECRFKYFLETTSEVVKTLESGDLISFGAGEPHMFTALEDSLMIEWLSGISEKTIYPPYRKIVEAMK